MNIKHEIEKKPENSGSSAQILADLRAKKSHLDPSSINKQIATLRSTLANPSTPESVKNSIEAAIHKISQRKLRAKRDYLNEAIELASEIGGGTVTSSSLKAAAGQLADHPMSAKVAQDKLDARAGEIAEVA